MARQALPGRLGAAVLLAGAVTGTLPVLAAPASAAGIRDIYAVAAGG